MADKPDDMAQLLAAFQKVLAQRQPVKPNIIQRIAQGTRYMLTGSQPEWFGPGDPLPPVAQEPAVGRQFDYPASINIWSKPRAGEPVSFDQLRGLADTYDLLRLVIETRKDQMEKLEWTIQLKQDDDQQRPAPDKRCAEVKKFFKRPDKEHRWRPWMRAILEDHFVIDAATLYPRRTRGGDLWGLELIDGACYSDDTEVLTRRGWLNFDQVDIATDEFATRDIKTKRFEWQKATYFHEVDYVGRMHRFHSRAVDLLVSPNHRMLVDVLPRSLGGSRHRERGEAVMTAAQLAEVGGISQRIPMCSAWEGIEVGAKTFVRDDPRSKAVVMTGDQYCAFMGMYLAEGSGNSNSVYVSQMPTGKGFIAYRDLITEILGRPALHTGTNFVISREALRDHVRGFGLALSKFIPQEIVEATPRQLAIFWKYFRLGDGARDRNRLYTSSSRMADQLTEIAQKLGWSASVYARKRVQDLKMADGRVIRAESCAVSYVISVRQAQAMSVRTEAVIYSGKIRCVSVPNEFLYVRRNGKPAWCGNTIKRIVDVGGRTPAPDQPAYQQVLHGLQAVDYVRPTYDFDNIAKAASGQAMPELMYMPHNVRTSRIYGFSRVEQILMTVNIALRHQVSQLQYFTEGNIPDSLLAAPQDWSADQIAAAQATWDSMTQGVQSVKRRAKWVPHGSVMTPTREPQLKGEFDEWLARIVCFCFSISPTAFIKQVNRASGETMKDQALEEGLAPIMAWVKEIVDEVIEIYFGYDDIEFVWSDEKDIDPATQATINVAYVTAGILTADEVRSDIGLGPLEDDQKPGNAQPNPEEQQALQMPSPAQASTDDGTFPAPRLPTTPKPGAPGDFAKDWVQPGSATSGVAGYSLQSGVKRTVPGTLRRLMFRSSAPPSAEAVKALKALKVPPRGGRQGPFDQSSIAKADNTKKEPLDAIAEQHEAAVGSRLSAAFGQIGAAANQAGAASPGALPIPARADIQSWIARALDPLVSAFQAGGKQTANDNPPIEPPDPKTISFRFDLTNPATVEAARTYQLKLAGDLTDQTMAAIQQAITDGVANGQPPAVVARQIRESLGLTPAQGTAVANYRAELEGLDAGALDRGLRDQRFDKTIQAAIDSNTALTPDQVDKMVGRYSDKMLAYRANMIARTESLRAANLGGRAAMRQAIARGDFGTRVVMRKWMTAPGCCAICQAIQDQNPDGVGMDEPFTYETDKASGEVDGAPAHPHCRCSETYSTVGADDETPDDTDTTS